MSFFKRQPEYLDRQSNAAKAKSALLEKFRDSGFRFRKLLVALVTSELFLQRGSG